MSQSTGDLQQRRDLLLSVLSDVGYTDSHVQCDWEVSDHEKLCRWREDDDPKSWPDGRPSRLDVVAFYDEREHNWDTTAIVAELDRLDLTRNKESGAARARRLFQLTASPCTLFAGNGTADLWLKCWQQPELIRDIPFAQESLRKRFRQHRRDLEREALARLRGGQRYLFDGVYHARREELVQFLHRGLSKATWLGDLLPKKDSEKSKYEEERKALSRVAIALMAARILEDKGFFGTSEQTTNARQLLANAEHEANGFFQQAVIEDLGRLDKRLKAPRVNGMLECLMAHLTGPASFSMVTADALGYLYETALTAERKRGKDVDLDGIHYTPRPIAQHILDRIPVEELRPSQRIVADVACGSGSFLLAATDRLRGVFDAREQDAEPNVLDHLRRHVIGNDTDAIAILVTRLAYLLEHWTKRREAREVPEPQSLWERDALEVCPEDFGGALPSVVVGNPPFGATGGGQQLANQFLLKAIELLAPGGFLGMIMPGGFLKMRRQKCPETRERLLRDAQLIEVWELPTRVVGLTAEQETCVIVARKEKRSDKSRSPVLFKPTYSRRGPAREALRERLRSTWTFVATGPPGRPDVPWREDEDSRIIASPIDALWRRLPLDQRLSDLCVDGTGIDAPLKKALFSSKRESQDFVPYFRTQKRLKPFLLRREDWWDDPDADHRFLDRTTALWPKKALWPLYDGPKVIVRCDTNRNTKLQIAAAYDDRGVYADHHFRCVGLRSESGQNVNWVNGLLATYHTRELLLWLTAALNSPVAHAWVATCAPPRGLLEVVLHSLPLPSEFDPEIPRLVEKTSQFERTVTEDTPLWDARSKTEATEFLRLAAQINDRVLASYGLGTRDVDLLTEFLQGMTEPWVDAPEDAHLPVAGAKYRRITGTVVSVDVKRQKVTLDLPRYSKKAGGPLKVPLPKHLPGWALCEGARFTCLAPANRREPADLQDPWLLREFRPIPYAYMEPSRIEEMAGFQALHSDV